MDSKIEEATRPVAAQRSEAVQQHSALDDEVKELRYELSACVDHAELPIWPPCTHG